MFKKEKKISTREQGFSFIGTMIAVAITSVSLVGILALVSASLRASNIGKMKLIASGLGQEAIEVIRDMRKAEVEWSDWYSAVVNGNYLIEYDSTSLLSFSETPLKFDDNTGLYQYSVGNNSPFYRKVTLWNGPSGEVWVTIEVKWLYQENWQYLITEDRLWNWK